jgi:hypothetical protein
LIDRNGSDYLAPALGREGSTAKTIKEAIRKRSRNPPKADSPSVSSSLFAQHPEPPKDVDQEEEKKSFNDET